MVATIETPDKSGELGWVSTETGGRAVGMEIRRIASLLASFGYLRKPFPILCTVTTPRNCSKLADDRKVQEVGINFVFVKVLDLHEHTFLP